MFQEEAEDEGAGWLRGSQVGGFGMGWGEAETGDWITLGTLWDEKVHDNVELGREFSGNVT